LSENLAFDPDKFNLDKKQILMVFSAIEKRWTSSKVAKLKNAKYVVSMEALKLAINWTDEEVLQTIWRDILFGFNELIRLNDLARMKEEFPNMEAMIDIVTKKLESGELFSNK